jgi:hypothetical protein
MSGRLQAGFGTREITPPLGVELSGYGYYLDRRAAGVLDPLCARCLLLDDGATRLALVSCDLIGFTIPFSDSVRREIAVACSTSAERVMLACTHTHSAPATAELLGLGAPDPEYMARLPGLIVEACREAAADLAPADAGWAIGEIEPIGFCRLGKAPPSDYEDPKLGALVCRRAKGDVGLVQYACHAVTLGVNKELSADYPGAVVRTMQSHGVEALFLNGPAGDIDPLINKVKWGSGTPHDVERYGRLLGDRADELFEQVKFSSSIRLAAKETRIVLPVRPPDEATLVQQREEARARFAAKNEPGDRFEIEAAERALSRLREERGMKSLDFVVQLLRIGDLGLVGLSGEVYSSVGRAAARAAGAPALVVAQANGVTGYIPDEATLSAGEDYGSSGAARIYSHFRLDPSAPRLIVEAVRRLAS